MKYLKIACLILFALLPSVLKIWCLRLYGAKIGKGCKIGISIISAKQIDIGDYVLIGHLNLIYRLNKLSMGSGSKIDSFNWITGGSIGDLYIGNNSSIRRFHFIEASGSMFMGNNTIVAGRSSLFFTHGLTPDNLNDVRSIKIGNWCYIGAACRFLPGASIGNGTFVGMGAVVTKQYDATYVLLAGNPARVRKEFSKDSLYFNRPFLRHSSHSEMYDGGE